MMVVVVVVVVVFVVTLLVVVAMISSLINRPRYFKGLIFRMNAITNDTCMQFLPSHVIKQYWKL